MVAKSQLIKDKKDIQGEISELQITLEYSIKLLEDYQGDLKNELKDITKTIKTSKNKLKKITERTKK